MIGGYIDQVAGSVDASESARFRPAGTVRENGLPASDPELASKLALTFRSKSIQQMQPLKKMRTEEYKGFRASLAQDLNDEWSVNLVLAHQTVDADGVFFVDPIL